jgi:hypothetical protein
MNKHIIRVGLGALLCFVTIHLSAVAQTPPGSGLPGGLPSGSGQAVKKGAYWEKQPEMKAALESLRSAMQSLKKASADKGGNRAKAMRLTREAIQEVIAGIRFDNSNLSPDEKKDLEDDLKKLEAETSEGGR